MDTLPTDLDSFGVEGDHKLSGLDHRLGVSLGTAHDGMDARHQLVLVERLGHVVVGTEAEPLDLVLDAGEPGQDQDRVLTLETRSERSTSNPDMMCGRLASYWTQRLRLRRVSTAA